MIPTRTPPAEPLRLVLRTQPRSVSPHSSVVVIRCALFLLLALFSLPARAGTLAQFRTVFGDIEVELYDQDKPVTVDNFIHYVQSGAWNDMFIHRCDPNFVIQGGGHYVANRSRTNQIINSVTKFGPIVNEFGVGRRFSNVYGTLAMAKVAGNTNSASSEWFFNLGDNGFLDAADTNNLFVVFGHVVGGTNILNVFKTFSRTSSTNTIIDLRAFLGGAFGELPLLTTNANYNDLIYTDVSLLRVQVRSTGAGAREISWNSVSNSLNHVEFTTNLPPSWQTLISTNGTGNTLQVVDDGAADAHRFYRVRVEY